LLVGCSETQVAQKAAVDLKPAAKPAPAAAKKQPATKVAAKVEADKDDEPAPFSVPQGYRYRPGDRRDPFVNPIPKPAASGATGLIERTEKPLVRPEGLPGVFLSEVKISGIIHSEDPAMRKAMLAAGKRTFFAGQGDPLLDAVVKEIRPSEIVFSMVSVTTRQPTSREITVAAGASAATLAGDKK
jgi:hypothetical protein